MTRKTGLGSLLLLGAAAFGVYKYSQMSDQQKQDLLNKGKKLADQGKKLVSEGVDAVKNRFSGQNAPENMSMSRG